MITKTLGTTGADFTSITSWVSWVQANAVSSGNLTDNVTLNVLAVGVSPTASDNVTGWAPGGSNFTTTITSTHSANVNPAVQSNAFFYDAANGAFIDYSGTPNNVLSLNIANVTLSNLQLKATYPNNSGAAALVSHAEPAYLTSNIIYGAGQKTPVYVQGGTTLTNNLLIGHGEDGAGIYSYNPVKTCKLYDNTIVGDPYYGVFLVGITNATVIGNVFLVSGSKEITNSGLPPTVTGSNNATTNSSFGGITPTTSGQTGIIIANEFMATNDFRLAPGSSQLRNHGTAITGVTTDWAGSTRPQGTEQDIGAWIFVSPPNVGTATGSSTAVGISSFTTTITLSSGTTWTVPANCPAGTVVSVVAKGGGTSPGNASGNYTVTPHDKTSGVPYTLGASSGGVTTWSTNKNLVPNAILAGAIVGSPGTLPTYWDVALPSGITQTVVGYGIDPSTGYPYVDLQYQGTATAAGLVGVGYPHLAGGGTELIPVTPSTTYIQSFYMAMTAGSMANLNSGNVGNPSFDEYSANNASDYVGGVYNGNIASLSSTLAPFTNTGTVIGTCTYVDQIWQLNITGAGAVNITVRFAAPQMELGSTETYWASGGYLSATAGTAGGTTGDIVLTYTPGPTGTATGTGTASAIGQSTATTKGTATGTSTASAIGQSVDTTTGTATGTSTASAIGQSVDTTTGTATGTGTTVATGTPFIFNFMSGSLPSGITFARASAATYFDHTGTMQTASSGVPRFDYNPTTLVLNGILVEEGRTNLLLNSASLSTQSVTTSATTYALSFYGTGTVTLSGTYSGSLTGSGAYPTRSSLVFTATAGTLTCTVTGTVTDGQLEGGNFPTSYIPTTSAAVTRQPDTMTFSSSILTTPFSIVVGAMYQTLGIAGSGQHLFYLQDASSSDGIRTYKAGNTTNVATAGVGTVSGSVASFTTILGTPFLYGMSYSGTTLLATMNGATPASATLTGSFTPATLNVGNDAGSGFTDGWLQTLTYWPTALTGAQLQSLTSSQTVGTATGTDTAPAIGQSTAATTGSSTNVTSFSRATTATYVNTSGNIATAAINVERTQYGSPYIESAAATNLQTQSQFASGTGNTNATVTLNSTTAPDTTTTAMLVTATAASTTIHLASQSESTPTASTNYCLSVFAFPGTEINVGVHIRVGGNWLNGVCDGSFVLSGAGTATLTAGGSQAGVGIANVGNGWYRCWVHGQSAATGLAGQTNWYSVQNSAGSDNYTATGNETCYFWGSQWELGTTPSSYIPTTTVAVTRAADILYDVAFSQSTALTIGTATGTGTASGESVVGATTGTATGSSTAAAIGQSTAATTGTATGSSTAAAIGQSTFATHGQATGASTAPAIGQSTAATTGTATGSSTAAAIGQSTFATHGQATGASTAPAIGQSAAATIATATGSSTAAAFSQQSGSLTTGTAAGTSAVSAIAQSTVASTGEAIGAGTGAAFAANIPVAIVIRGGAADAETERQKYFDWKTRHPRRKKVSPPAPSQTTPPSVVAAAPLSAADLIATLRSNLVGDHRQAISAVQNDAKNQQLHAMLRQIIAHHMARDDEEALAYLLAD